MFSYSVYFEKVRVCFQLCTFISFIIFKYEVITVHTPTVQEMYAFCHEALADYVESFETYANFKELV